MDAGAECYRRFLGGEEAAFDEIMELLFHNLVFFLDQYVHDVHTAEDLAMDTFSDLIVHKHRYNFKVTLKTYLFMIGRCRAIDYLRHQKVLRFSPLEEGVPISAEEQTLCEMVLADARKQSLHAAIRCLPQDMQTVVTLIYFEDLSYEEAASVMKKSKKQVDNLLYRAKKELRSRLEKEGDLF